MLNWSLMREPLNWLIVGLMVAIGAAGLALIMAPPGSQDLV